MEDVVLAHSVYSVSTMSIHHDPFTRTKTLRFRVKDKHAKFFSVLARDVNFVWNY